MTPEQEQQWNEQYWQAFEKITQQAEPFEKDESHYRNKYKHKQLPLQTIGESFPPSEL